MKLGIMQPYLFPYIGYFQLVNSVDRFVVYDDVAFIKQGWINRNRILLNGAEHVFTVPLKNASSFVTIAQTEINKSLYAGWKAKFLKTLAQAYSKAPHYASVNDMVTSILNEGNDTISELATKSMIDIASYLGLSTTFVNSAIPYDNSELKAMDRVIDICNKERADEYINPIGGTELYAKEDFEKQGITLRFIESKEVTYNQFNHTFVPWLSIIDVLMFNSVDETRLFMDNYNLV